MGLRGRKAAILLLGLLILGCPRAPEERREKGGELWVGMMEEPSSLNPLDLTPFGPRELLDLLYLSLYRLDPQGRPIPELAQSWEFSEDLKSITYHLRPGVCWWDGKELTAEDLVSAYEALKGRTSQLALIERVELLGPYTVRFTARCPYSDFLIDANLKPIPSHQPLELLGNGPYRLDSWSRGDRMILTANDGFYRDRPPLDRIVIRFFRDPTRMVEEFLADQLDLLFGLPLQLAVQLEGLPESERVVIREPGERYLFVGWNLSHPFLARHPVRLALTMAVDRARLLEEVYLGAGQVVAGPIPPGSWAFDSTLQPLPYDPGRASELLETQGYRDTDRDGIREIEGRPIVLDLLVTPTPERVRIAEELSRSLAQVGVRVRVITLGSREFLDRVGRGEFDGFLMSWEVSERLDPSPVWHSEGRYNFTGYQTPEVDSLIQLGVSQFNRRLARSIWQEFQRRVAEDAPYLFLFAPQRVTVFKPRVHGLKLLTLSQLADCWVPSAQRRVAISPPRPETLALTPVIPALAPETLAPPRVEEVPPAVPETLPPPEELLEAETLPPKPPPFIPAVYTPPEPVSIVSPEYPEVARTVGATGTVVVRVVVDEAGTVKEARIVRGFGNPACDAAALEAARRCIFRPATRDGVPIESPANLQFQFRD